MRAAVRAHPAQAVAMQVDGLKLARRRRYAKQASPAGDISICADAAGTREAGVNSDEGAGGR